MPCRPSFGCPCESYQLIIASLCDDPLILTDLVADETGIWRAEIEFNNGLINGFEVGVVFGQPVVIPNVLNEDYLHEARFYRETGELIGCFWIGGPQFNPAAPCQHINDELGNRIIHNLSGKPFLIDRHA